MNEIERKVKAYCTKNEISQAQLAKNIDIDRHLLNRVIMHPETAGIRMIKRVASAINSDANELITDWFTIKYALTS